ncbi:hypothetical protein [Allokutzneria albata]|uniref:Uncharacterized protein n=1 Tax=Allokutzneria albata TaxID=211114 RepID=A0A1H0B1M6_ALLAB|nr:hypothetical protein [Allokutzneria albata]SDN39496.1 hypothetical protein SAMN04489726_6418 [Allokutzneria albata]
MPFVDARTQFTCVPPPSMVMHALRLHPLMPACAGVTAVVRAAQAPIALRSARPAKFSNNSHCH